MSEPTDGNLEPTPDTPQADPNPAPVVSESGEEIVAVGEEAEARMRELSRRSFLWAGVASLGLVGGVTAFQKYAPEEEGGIKTLFRQTHRFNEAVARAVFFSPNHLDREFPEERAVRPRNNFKGATSLIDLEAWKLALEGSEKSPAILSLEDLKTLPEASQTTELKCVEGWSAVVHWTGVRFRDFAEKYPPPAGARYVAMRSEPEGWERDWYYVGLDLESCLHPQTLLAYAMNGKPLEPAHGAPLRLVMPHKYGIKNIKLITHIAYTAERPRDYWADRGYDWYAGL